MISLGYTLHCLSIFRTQGSREQLFLGIPYPGSEPAEPRLTWWEAEEHWTFLPEFLLWGAGYSFDSMTRNCENKTSAPWYCSAFGKWVFENKSHSWNTWGVSNPSRGHQSCEGCASALDFVPEREICLNCALWNCWRNLCTPLLSYTPELSCLSIYKNLRAWESFLQCWASAWLP